VYDVVTDLVARAVLGADHPADFVMSESGEQGRMMLPKRHVERTDQSQICSLAFDRGHRRLRRDAEEGRAMKRRFAQGGGRAVG
jgi:hypothetical protein